MPLKVHPLTLEILWKKSLDEKEKLLKVQKHNKNIVHNKNQVKMKMPSKQPEHPKNTISNFEEIVLISI